MIDVGLIGFGLGGRCFHAQVIHAVEGLRLSAVLLRAGNASEELYPEAQIVRTIDELLAIDSIRLVVISTPNDTHFPFAQRCLEAGRNVVVDKPFTTNVADAVELLSLAKKKNLVLSVFHSRRFDADFQGLRKAVVDGKLGRIVRFESSYDRFRLTPKPGAWKEKPGPGTGVLFDLAPHLIDQSLMLLGTPEGITADSRTERPGFSTDDAFDIFLHYPEGTRSLLRATMMSAVPRPRLFILGDKGTYIKREFDPLEPALRNGSIPAGSPWLLEKEEDFGELTTVANGGTSVRKIPSIGDWREFYVNVRDVILGNAQLLVTHQQILNVMVALELIQQSGNQHRTIPWRNIPI